MASGKEHDQSTMLWVTPFAIFIGFFLDLHGGLIAGATFFLGGLWLSPDLDTNSLAIKRWGILKNLWWPYQKIIPHRSFLSHSPLLGTALRLSYLFMLTTLFISLLKPFGFATHFSATHFIKDLVQQHPKKVLAGLIGLEASAWLHLVKDGDPIPTGWHKQRKIRK